MIYDYIVDDAQKNPVKLADFKGQVVLIVNTASKCGFTKQYEGLEALYQKYKDQGFTVLAFPCDQFGHQEPLEGQEILNFCQDLFSVTFPVMDKVKVNGDQAIPLYKELKEAQGGLLGSEIKWNFTKFLIDREGRVVDRFAPQKTPKSIEPAIEGLL